MCVIVVKEAGVPVPKNEVLRDCFQHNGDGAGFAFARGGQVYIRKGFMTWRSFRKGLRRERLTDQDSVMYHFRIATAGLKSPENTHPFPVTSSEKLLSSRWIKTDCAVAHNGILYREGEGEKSDTFIFVRDVLALPEAKLHVRAMDEGIIRFLADGGKFAFLYGTGECVRTGRDWDEENGLYFSNMYHDWSSRMWSYHDMLHYDSRYVRRVEPKRTWNDQLAVWDEVDQAVYEGTASWCPACQTTYYNEYVGMIRGESIYECFTCNILFTDSAEVYEMVDLDPKPLNGRISPLKVSKGK